MFSTHFRAIALGILACGVLAAAGPSLYVSAYKSSNLLDFSVASGRGIAKFSGAGGLGNVISRNGQVLADINGDITVVNTQTKTVINTIPVGFTLINSVAVSSNGKTVFSATPSGSIGFFDVASGTMTGSVPLNASSGAFLAISPNSQTLYALYGNGIQTLCSISIPTATITNCLQVSPNAYNTEVFSRALAVSSDGTKVYGFSDPYSIGVFDATSLTLLNSIRLTDPSNAAVDSLVLSPANNSLYVSSYGFGGPNSVFRIDLASFTVAAQQTLSYQPVDVAVTPSGSKVYLVGYGNPASIFEGINLTPVGTIASGYGVSAVIGPY